MLSEQQTTTIVCQWLTQSVSGMKLNSLGDQRVQQVVVPAQCHSYYGLATTPQLPGPLLAAPQSAQVEVQNRLCHGSAYCGRPQRLQQLLMGPGTIAEAKICGLPMHLLDLIAGQCNAWMICLSWEWVNIESNLCHPFTEFLTVIFLGSTIYSNHQSILYAWPMKISLRLPLLHPSRPLSNAHKVNFK
ncbi:unnamed protein product [Sphagnum jensenii]|uniref:Uncharacterized protein n=1 Tax=Sphagnum jensenii TaxID=128206 RepID=A0ABP1BPZ6_9BRYO